MKNKKCPNFKSDTTFIKKNNCSYSQKCNWNVCEIYIFFEIWFNSLCRFSVDLFFCYVVWVLNQKLIEQLFCSLFAWWYDTPLRSRFLMVSTNQADPSCFYFRISWILMEWRWFYFFHPLHFLQGLRSLKALVQLVNINYKPAYTSFKSYI